MSEMKKWITWDGRVKDVENISHQHLSNIHYFMMIVNPNGYSSRIKKFVMESLMEKFDSILPYRPHPKFVGERHLLSRLGYLRDNGDIVFNGNKVGWYE